MQDKTQPPSLQDDGFVVKALPAHPRTRPTTHATEDDEPRAKPRRGRPLGMARVAIVGEVNNNARARRLSTASGLSESLKEEYSPVTIRNTTHALTQEGRELDRHPDGFMYYPPGWIPAALPIEEARLIHALAALPRPQRLAMLAEFGARLGLHDLAEQASPELPAPPSMFHTPTEVDWGK